MPGGTILIADDDTAIRTVLNQALARAGYAPRATGNAATLWRWVSQGEGDVVITDVVMPDENAFDLIPRIKKLRPDLPVIVMSAQNTLMTALSAAEKGAYEYLPKPFDLNELVTIVGRALAEPGRRKEPGQNDAEGEELPLIGRSPPMQEIYRALARLTRTDLTVMITGESGTGKELVARVLHDYSKRRNGPFVAINMAAIPRELIESELFGHEKGAFTGAHKRKLGKFELADGGTIFLDEIGEMPLPLQAKLLHVLQDREFARLGSGRDIKVDVRVVASTNKDLERAVAQGGFREDLYYRLNVVNILVPPLRDRPEEIPILAEHFWQKYSRQYNRALVPLSRDMLERFRTHAWPGNVRELENLVKRIVVLESEEFVTQELMGRGSGLDTTNGAAGIRAEREPGAAALAVPTREEESPRRRTAWTPGVGLKDVARQAAREAEHGVIKQVLEEVRWNRVEAARRLKISYKALLYKIQMYELAIAKPAGKKLP